MNHEIDARHECNKAPDYDSIRILKVIYDEEEPYWVLSSASISNEKEVADGEASEVGEVMSNTEITIDYCPFCGQRL